jgi:hypothetical protein
MKSNIIKGPRYYLWEAKDTPIRILKDSAVIEMDSLYMICLIAKLLVSQYDGYNVHLNLYIEDRFEAETVEVCRNKKGDKEYFPAAQK